MKKPNNSGYATVIYREEVIAFMKLNLLKSMIPYFIVALIIDFWTLYASKDFLSFFVLSGVILFVFSISFIILWYAHLEKYYMMALETYDAIQEVKKAETLLQVGRDIRGK